MTANFTPDQKEYKSYQTFGTFRLFVSENFPFIEDDFDSLTYYQMLCKIVGYLKDVITNNESLQYNQTKLLDAFNELQNYVNTYFDSLDIQTEINNKLDQMAQDGTLTNLIEKYMTPIINEQNERINSISNLVNSSVNMSPIPVSSITGMVDTSKIYLNTTDGYWYYYNGSNWIQGGLYLSPSHEIEWEQGGFNNGNLYETNQQIRTKNFLTLNDLFFIKTNNENFIFAVVCYDENFQFVGNFTGGYSSVWNFQVFINQVINQYQNAKNFKISLKNYDSISDVNLTDSIYINIYSSLDYTFFVEQHFENKSDIIPFLFGDLPNGSLNYNKKNFYTPFFINLKNITRILTNENYEFALVVYVNNEFYENFKVNNNIWLNNVYLSDVINSYEQNINLRLVFRNKNRSELNYDDLNYLLFINNKDDFIYNTLNNSNLFEKNISILGDSISTFSGYIPTGYVSQYPNADVQNVNDTWWKKIINNFSLNLIINNSYAGSRVSNTNTSIPNANERCENLSKDGINPDIILIEMGVNDFINNVPLGSYDGTTELTNDLSNFRSAYANLLKKINELYPNSITYCCTILPMQRSMNRNFPQTGNNNTLLTEWNNAIVELAQLFNCKVLRHDMCGITYQNQNLFIYDYSEDGNGLHPNKAGMERIALNDIKNL